MKISSRKVGEVTILDLSGRMVAGEAGLLRDAMRDLIARGEKNCVLNLADVPYIDSAGIGFLVSALVAVRRESGYLWLLCPTRRVRDVLGIVKLLTVFQIFENEKELVASVTAQHTYLHRLIARAG